MRPSGRGIDRHAYLIGEYAVLSTKRLKLRNVDTRDDDLRYLDEIIEMLWRLHESGVSVVPILGYCCDEGSADGCGYMFQQRAIGRELYDDAIMTRFDVWAQNRKDIYISCPLPDEEAVKYLLERTGEIARIPQTHFDKLIHDIIAILQQDILIDFNGRSNFFYDKTAGFQLIDLDAHNDYRYGLTEEKPDVETIVAYMGFTPCHYAMGTKIFPHVALDEQALSIMNSWQLSQLAADNRLVFQKCRTALRNNRIPDQKVERALKALKLFV